MPEPVRLSRMGLVNCWLVDEDDGLTLIDTMLPGSARTIIPAAADLGKPIARIALTHAHFDHVGALDAVAEQLPQAEVLISARDARFLAGDRSLDPDELAKSKLRGSYKAVKTRPTRTIEAGERIGSLEVIASPGHTPGHIAFLDTRDRTLYCGDVFSTLGGVATTAKVNPSFPLPAMGTWHRPTELESARALRALEPAALAPGHGKLVPDPGAEMDAAISRAAR